MTDRCDRAETTAMALVGAAHYGTRGDVARILRGADLLAVAIWLARAVDPTKSADELMAWVDPDVSRPDRLTVCGVPSWPASYERHRLAGHKCATCSAQMSPIWRDIKRRRAQPTDEMRSA